MFGFSPKVLIVAVSVLVMIAGFGLYTRWVYQQGVGSERQAVVERSLSRTAERNADDEEIRNLDYDGLCREYGAAKWVPERQGCQ